MGSGHGDGVRPPEHELRFERALVRVRWFGIAFATFQVLTYTPFPGTTLPRSLMTFAALAVTILAVANVAVIAVLRTDPAAAALRRVGAFAFAADLAALWAFVWAFSFEEFGATWVILAFGVLEGAFRYQIRGTLIPLLLTVVIEPLRDWHRTAAFDFDFYLDSFTFRIGFLIIVAAVTGVMARDLTRERERALARAHDLEHLAEREQAARNESNAFQQVILAGVSAAGMQEALQRMVEHIAEHLGYEHIAVLMREGEELHVVAMRGFSPIARATSIRVGESISGHVAATGLAEIIPDVSKDPRYYSAEPSTRSQVTVPIVVGEDVIGVLDCESPEVDAFDAGDAARLERLAAQMGLVVENARLLSNERAMVERLRELDQMRSDFIAIASHELRTPLTAIQGSIKTLRRLDERISREEFNEFLAIVDRQSDRLTRLVEDLLMVSRIDSGAVNLQMGEVDLTDALADVLAEIGARAVRVSIAIPPTMPPLHTDGHRLRQIVRNLVENALKFSPEHTTVRVTAHDEGEHLRLEVADDGPGIPEEDVAHIFERFYQVGGSLRRRADGFGLGLYITRRLVEALGGTIEVASSPERGTTFIVRVPAVRAADDAETA